MQELEQALKKAPTTDDILQSHAAASASYLGDQEKKTVKNIANKLELLLKELRGLTEKRKRVSLKEKIMIEIETGRVGSRKNPVPALSKKISATQVSVRFLTETSDLIKSLSSQLQINSNKTSRLEENFRKKLNEKKKTINNQGLRIRQYEQNAVKQRQQHSHGASLMMNSPIAPLSIVLNSLGPENRIDTPAGTLVLLPNNEMSLSESGGSIEMDGLGITSVTVTHAGDHGSVEPSAPNKLEQSLKHVGGLPPMGTALTTDAPHLIPPHMLPRGGSSGDPRDNGRPGSNSSKGRRDKWMYDQKGAFKRATVPEMFQISTGRRDPLTGKIAWKNNGIFNRFDAIELFAGRTRNIYRQ